MERCVTWGEADMRYWLAATALLFTLLGAAPPVAAQDGRIRPECRRTGDPRACTCALDNGGMMVADPHRPNRMRWRSPRLGTGAHMAFMNCSNRAGRRG
jgi:hypothetical protein